MESALTKSLDFASLDELDPSLGELLYQRITSCRDLFTDQAEVL